jgi:hypothetical protein
VQGQDEGLPAEAFGTGAWPAPPPGGLASAPGGGGGGAFDTESWPVREDPQAAEPPSQPWVTGSWTLPPEADAQPSPAVRRPDDLTGAGGLGDTAAPAGLGGTDDLAGLAGTGGWALPPGGGPQPASPLGTGGWPVQPGQQGLADAAGTGAYPLPDVAVGPPYDDQAYGEASGGPAYGGEATRAHAAGWVQDAGAGVGGAGGGAAPTGYPPPAGAYSDGDSWADDGGADAGAAAPSATGPVPVAGRSRRRSRRAGRWPLARASAPGGADYDVDDDRLDGDEVEDDGGVDGRVDADGDDLYGSRGRFGGLGSLPRPILAGLSLAVLALLVVGAFLVLGGGEEDHGGTAAPASTSTRGGRYDEKVRRVFLDECVRVSEGAAAYCTCTLEKLEAGYSQGEYLEFSDNVGDAKSQQIIRKISESCRAAG